MKTFWYVLTMLVILWYVVVTAYVGFKGVTDIKKMLKRLEDQKNEEEDAGDNLPV